MEPRSCCCFGKVAWGWVGRPTPCTAPWVRMDLCFLHELSLMLPSSVLQSRTMGFLHNVKLCFLFGEIQRTNYVFQASSRPPWCCCSQSHSQGTDSSEHLLSETRTAYHGRGFSSEGLNSRYPAQCSHQFHLAWPAESRLQFAECCCLRLTVPGARAFPAATVTSFPSAVCSEFCAFKAVTPCAPCLDPFTGTSLC